MQNMITTEVGVVDDCDAKRFAKYREGSVILIFI